MRGRPPRINGTADGDAELWGVSAKAQDGALLVAIVGRSGCGKSTLLRLLAGLDRPRAGAIRLLSDFGLTRAPAQAARLMFQEPRLLPWARVRRNVEVGLPSELAGGDGGTLALRALDQIGLAGCADEWPSVLSGGQKQRVALACALVSRPQLLALDEPLGALDALTRIDMQGLIETVWRQQRFTAVLATHDVSEAVVLADRIILLHDGEVALDVMVDLPRPRRRGDAEFAAVEGLILDRLFETEPAAHRAA